MLKIQTTGVDDYLDGSANIKALIIGGPGAGKTRSSSYWPRPIFLDCENGRGSLADRKMPFVEVRSSKDMLDALEYLKALERTPKAQRQFQTVVVDTGDSFQRIVKDEWVQQTKAATFSGFDAWGYLDTKMQLLFTRLLNLDYNVLVLVHHKDKTYKDGDNTVREFTLQLQGAISDQIFNDFGLVGFLGTYWAAGENGRVQKRGLTFQPTPDKPFLKDRFNVTPKWMEITFSDEDYNQIFRAFFERKEFEEFPEAEELGEIPDSEVLRAQAQGPISKPTEGGPLSERSPVQPADLPLEKQTKEQLSKKAQDLGIPVRGNTLKSELVAAIKAKQDEATDPKPAATEVDPGATPPPVPADPPSQPHHPLDSTGRRDQGVAGEEEVADAAAASPEESSETATSGGQDDDEAPVLTPEAVAERLGGEVISTDAGDASATPQSATPPPTVTKPTAPTGPSACADCGADLSEEWADPSKKDYIRLSFVKYRRYLCTGCYATAVK